MRPVQLTLQAFGSYGTKTVIDFTRPNQNLFLVTGATGSGKTTIFDGIVFALYGEASSGSNRKDGTELQSQYVDYGVKPYVELVFSEYSGGEEKDLYGPESPQAYPAVEKRFRNERRKGKRVLDHAGRYGIFPEPERNR